MAALEGALGNRQQRVDARRVKAPQPKTRVVALHIEAILLASRFVGAPAILRFYVLHCVGFPLVAAFLIAVHFWRVRKDGGISGPL